MVAFKVFCRETKLSEWAQKHRTAVIIWCRIDSGISFLLSLETSWPLCSLLRYKKCSLWFFLFCAITFNADQLGRLFSENEREKLPLELKSKHMSLLPVWHWLWFFWDNLSLHFFSPSVEYPLLLSDHLMFDVHTIHMIHKLACCPFSIKSTVCFRDIPMGLQHPYRR